MILMDNASSHKLAVSLVKTHIINIIVTKGAWNALQDAKHVVMPERGLVYPAWTTFITIWMMVTIAKEHVSLRSPQLANANMTIMKKILSCVIVVTPAVRHAQDQTQTSV